jgi:hypothetical protein
MLFEFGTADTHCLLVWKKTPIARFFEAGADLAVKNAETRNRPVRHEENEQYGL